MLINTIENSIKECSKDFRLVAEKVIGGERISVLDATALINENNFAALGLLADFVRRKKNGDKTYYIVNRHINYTNICENHCRFCAYRKENENTKGAFTLSLKQIEEKAVDGVKQGADEFHIVGALNKSLPFSYYTDMLSTVRSVAPNVHIQAFTAVEIDFLSKIANMSLEETILKLKEAGLDSTPGGGAEIFSEDIREIICPTKTTSDRWLEVSGTLHKLGIYSNATMLFGHIEKVPHIIDHLNRLRGLQDKTGGFVSFIPLLFHPQNTEYENTKPLSSEKILSVYALSRIFLDNIEHIKAFWIMLGLKLAAVSQNFGVDDIDGTVSEEKITHAAGAKTPEVLSVEALEKMIKDNGFIPVRRDTLYNEVNN